MMKRGRVPNSFLAQRGTLPTFPPSAPSIPPLLRPALNHSQTQFRNTFVIFPIPHNGEFFCAKKPARRGTRQGQFPDSLANINF